MENGIKAAVLIGILLVFPGGSFGSYILRRSVAVCQRSTIVWLPLMHFWISDKHFLLMRPTVAHLLEPHRIFYLVQTQLQPPSVNEAGAAD